MAFISVSGNTDFIQSALDTIATIGTRPEEVLKAIWNELRNRTVRRMEQGVDPDGMRWESYAAFNPLYEEDKKIDHILIESGDLRKDIHSEVEGNALLVGMDLD